MKNFFKNIQLGALAVLFGLTLVITQSAFTADKENLVKYSFRYSGPNTMTEAEVEDESNWTYDPSTTGCPSGADEACTITIDQAYVNTSAPNPQLDPSANLVADLGSFGTAYVASSADATIVKQNRQH